METVKLHVNVDIQATDPAYDTGITVAQWNAMTPEERSNVRSEAWSVVAQADNGGVWLVTDGATED